MGTYFEELKSAKKIIITPEKRKNSKNQFSLIPSSVEIVFEDGKKETLKYKP